jgi:hypothetical protein
VEGPEFIPLSKKKTPQPANFLQGQEGALVEIHSFMMDSEVCLKKQAVEK